MTNETTAPVSRKQVIAWLKDEAEDLGPECYVSDRLLDVARILESGEAELASRRAREYARERQWTEADDDRIRELVKGMDWKGVAACPKCRLGEGGQSEQMLALIGCQHKYCPVREWRDAKSS